MSLWGTLKSGFKSVAGAVLGTSSDAGILGSGQYKAPQYGVKDSSFTDTSKSDEDKAKFDEQLQALRDRGTPQGQAANFKQTVFLPGAQYGAANLVGATNVDPSNTVTGATLGNDDAAFRGGQSALSGQLADQAAGRGPSLATGQMNAAQDRALKENMSLAGSQRGFGNASLAMRNLGAQTAASQQQTAQDAAQLRIQEQLQARAQLGDVLSSGRQQDLGKATTQAGFSQQANLANQSAINDRNVLQAQLNAQKAQLDAASQNQIMMAQAQMNQDTQKTNVGLATNRDSTNAQYQQQMALANLDAESRGNQTNDAAIQAALASRYGIDQQNKMDLMNLENLKSGNTNTTNTINAGTYDDAAKRRAGMVQSVATGLAGGGASGAGGAAGKAMSDEREKKNVTSGSKDLRAFFGKLSDDDKKELGGMLNKLSANKYEYKDDANGEGEYISPMAQELEKSKLGKSMVFENPKGKKMVDYGKGLGTMLAALADMNDRVSKIEKKKAK